MEAEGRIRLPDDEVEAAGLSEEEEVARARARAHAQAGSSA